MYRGAGGRCPACEGALAQLTGTTLPLAGCAACGGVWLGPEAAVHVMRGLGDHVDVELARASAARLPEAVEKACSKLRQRHQQEDGQADDITAAGLAEGAGLIVTGTFSLAWGALVNVVEWMVTPRPSYDRYGNRLPRSDD